MNLALDSPTLVDGLQVLLRLNTSNFDYSKADSKGDDIRFGDESGHSLNYWIDVWNTSGESRVWIKVQLAGTTALRMSYGNSNAPAASDGDRTFEFFDDFNDGIIANKWIIPSGSTYGKLEEMNGQLTLTGKWVSPGQGFASVTSLMVFTSPFIADWRTQKVNGQVSGISFGDGKNTSWDSISLLDCMAESPNWELRGAGDFGGNWPGTHVDAGTVDANWYELTALAHDYSWQAFRGYQLGQWIRNDTLTVGSLIDNRPFYIYLWSHEMGNTVSNWDWIRVRKYAERIPSVEIGKHAISMSVEKTEYLPGESVAVRSRLTFETPSWSRPLPLKNISFEIDDPAGTPYTLMVNTTDPTGNATVSFTLPLDAPEGTYNCSATANVSGTVLLATGSFRVVWPWSAVMTVTPLYSSVYHFPGDLIEILAYTGYRYAPADANRTAIGSNLTARVAFSDGTVIMSFDRLTGSNGLANMSFIIPDLVSNGTYNVTITGFENKTWSGQFLARGIEGVFRLKTVTSPANVNRGAAFTISVVIENSRASYVNCLFVVQILDSNNVPLRPTIQKLNVTRSPGFLANVTITIDPKSPTGIYHVQVQLLTGLPKDRGYALDYRNGTILVQ